MDIIVHLQKLICAASVELRPSMGSSSRILPAAPALHGGRAVPLVPGPSKRAASPRLSDDDELLSLQANLLRPGSFTAARG